MDANQRKILIEKSLNIRTFTSGDDIFVNIQTPMKPLSFTCTMDTLDYHIDTHELKKVCLVTSFSINGEPIKLDSCFVSCKVDESNVFRGTLSNGDTITCDGFDYAYDGITPTAEEYKSLILKELEAF